MKTKTYISGNISGLTENEYKPLFWDAYMKVFTRGEEPISPMYFKPYEPKFKWLREHLSEWQCFMIVCIKKLLKCNKILMLPNWKNSKVARVEHFIAKLMRIEIEYYELY